MEQTTAIVWSERFQDHETGNHPENGRRLVAIRERLSRAGLLEHRLIVEPNPATVEDILLVHEADYVRQVERLARGGGGYLDADTWVSPRTYDVALLAAGAAIAATDRVLTGVASRSFAFPRPPGHHAERGRGMGFCVFNSVAIAARHALDTRGLQRVAIIDWDVHHGNGTQEIFQESDQVLYVSVHQSPLYPGTGRSDERGVRHGFGYTLNVPLRPGSGDEIYFRVFDEVIGPRLADFDPELLIVSAGYDAHVGDPLAMMRVSDAGFAGMSARVRAWAQTFCGGRLVLVLEGGYNLDGLASGVEATLRALDLPDSSSEEPRR